MRNTKTQGDYFTTGALLACLLSLALVVGAEAKDFEDKFGRTIEAELVSHTGKDSDTVKIRMKGKDYDTKIDKFSKKDQEFIRKWMAKTPPDINYRFRVEALKKKQSTVRVGGYYYSSAKSDMYVYEVKVTNTSTQPVSDLTIKYQAVMQDNVGVRTGGSYYSTSYGRGLAVIEDTIKVKGTLKFNQSATFVTKPFKIDSTRYGGYYSTSSKFKDSILGCRVRVLDATGKVQEDYRTKNTKFARLNLDGGGSGTAVKIE